MLEPTKVSIHGPQLARKLRNILIWDQLFLTGLNRVDLLAQLRTRGIALFRRTEERELPK
jgi:hypothetical protein